MITYKDLTIRTCFMGAADAATKRQPHKVRKLHNVLLVIYEVGLSLYQSFLLPPPPDWLQCLVLTHFSENCVLRMFSTRNVFTVFQDSLKMHSIL